METKKRAQKVGILTFLSLENFGAILQGYALNQAFLDRGCDCELIRYGKAERKGLLGYKLRRPTLRARAYAIACIPFRARKYRKFQDFQKRRMRLSETFYLPETLDNANARYDLFVSGSDQVWNDSITGKNDFYFQKFVREANKKCSYAASFGRNLSFSGERREQVARMLAEFRVLSVRESAGVEVVRELTGREAIRTPDPVLLRTAREWKEIAQTPGNPKPFLFISTVRGISPEMKALAERIRRRTGWKIVIYQPHLLRVMRGKHVRVIGPEQFLGFLLCAEIVLTDSFHTTLLSILFHKNFWTFLGTRRNRSDARVESLLDTFRLAQRLTVNGDMEDPLLAADFSQTDTIAEAERAKGQMVLDAILRCGGGEGEACE